MPIDPNLEIYCPACQWEPDGGAHWVCDCGCVWNTFDTGGVCPQCRYRWRRTGCPSCTVWSLHVDWYHGLDEEVAELVEAALSAPSGVCCSLNES
ncbi:hypothetical protein [Hymenobacter terricola]|uniref:hypothetical protein n=1 Tax=Hymenobacter terricola TaxID=2819236 RepID=UPI001B30CFE5|nr:hypothetical protein [Hymenobacter terricola]